MMNTAEQVQMHFAIRADGNTDIGYGHLVRTGVLAQEFLKRGHEVTYLTKTPLTVASVCPNSVKTYQLANEQADGVEKWLKKNDPRILLTDTYGINADYQKTLCKYVPVFATITDDTRFTLCCDVNINGNVHAPKLNYDWVGKKPQMLLGTEYLLLRDTFQHLSQEMLQWRHPPERALITFGGSDMNNTTPDAVRAFDGCDLDVDIIIGPGFTNKSEITEAARRTDATFEIAEDPDDLPERMLNADFAVSATGSTVYELLVTGTPVIGVPQTNNQVPVINELSSRGAIISLNRENVVTFDEQISHSESPRMGNINSKALVSELTDAIAKMTRDGNFRSKLRNKGISLVDGEGSNRVFKQLIEIVNND